MNRHAFPLACTAAFLGACFALAAGVRPNLTPSLPVGLYHLRSLPTEPRRGDVVELCLPPAIAGFGIGRGYVGYGGCPDGSMPLLKPVAAVPGDTVQITPEAVLVNGVPVVPPALSTDSAGRLLPALAQGLYRVQPGEVWLLSDHERRSWDGRYYGPVPISALRHTAAPLLTF